MPKRWIYAAFTGMAIAAELGTVYLQSGNRPQAIRYYELERNTWPESTLLMTAMIQNLERLEKGTQGDKQ